MTSQDPYQLWKADRAAPTPDPAFADMVMNQVRLLGPYRLPVARRAGLMRLVSLAAALVLGGLSLILARLVCSAGLLLGVIQKGL